MINRPYAQPEQPAASVRHPQPAGWGEGDGSAAPRDPHPPAVPQRGLGSTQRTEAVSLAEGVPFGQMPEGSLGGDTSLGESLPFRQPPVAPPNSASTPMHLRRVANLPDPTPATPSSARIPAVRPSDPDAEGLFPAARPESSHHSLASLSDRHARVGAQRTSRPGSPDPWRDYGDGRDPREGHGQWPPACRAEPSGGGYAASADGAASLDGGGPDRGRGAGAGPPQSSRPRVEIWFAPTSEANYGGGGSNSDAGGDGGIHPGASFAFPPQSQPTAPSNPYAAHHAQQAPPSERLPDAYPNPPPGSGYYQGPPRPASLAAAAGRPIHPHPPPHSGTYPSAHPAPHPLLAYQPTQSYSGGYLHDGLPQAQLPGWGPADVQPTLQQGGQQLPQWRVRQDEAWGPARPGIAGAGFGESGFSVQARPLHDAGEGCSAPVFHLDLSGFQGAPRSNGKLILSSRVSGFCIL